MCVSTWDFRSYIFLIASLYWIHAESMDIYEDLDHTLDLYPGNIFQYGR